MAFFANLQGISKEKLTCINNFTHRGIYLFSDLERLRRHFLLEMPQIASIARISSSRGSLLGRSEVPSARAGNLVPEAARLKVDVHVREPATG